MSTQQPKEDVELKLYKYNDEYIRYYNNYCYCGEPGAIGQEPEEWLPASEIFESDGESSYIADILGDSMIEADIRPGDRVVIDTTRTAREHDIVLAQVDGNYTLKYFAKDQDGRTWLVPANERYKPMIIDLKKDSNRIVGVMTSLIRKRPAFDSVIAKRLSKAYEEYRRVEVDEGMDKPFYKNIPNDKNKKRVLERLHNILDGQDGIAVIKILRAAIEVNYLIKMPSLGELEKEFDIKIQNSFFYRERNKAFAAEEMEDYKDSLTC